MHKFYSHTYTIKQCCQLRALSTVFCVFLDVFELVLKFLINIDIDQNLKVFDIKRSFLYPDLSQFFRLQRMAFKRTIDLL